MIQPQPYHQSEQRLGHDLSDRRTRVLFGTGAFSCIGALQSVPTVPCLQIKCLAIADDQSDPSGAQHDYALHEK